MDSLGPAPKVIASTDEYALVEIKENTQVVYYAGEDEHGEVPVWSKQEVLSPPVIDIEIGTRREGLSSDKAAEYEPTTGLDNGT